MNKLTKLGVSALCGSLAAVSSANAGDLAVTGGVDMTWSSMDDTETGNPLGIGSNVNFTGSGELDNGIGVAVAIAYTNKANYSSTNVTLNIPSLGDLIITQGVSGTGLDRMDDVTPTVWEESHGFGLSTGINTVSGVAGAGGFEYTPNMLPAGMTARIAYTPDATAGAGNDKTTSGKNVDQGSGYDLTLVLSDEVTGMSGLTIGGGISRINGASSDQDEEAMYATYAVGGFTLGYQISKEDLGTTSNEQEYENDGYGITFNINDDLSIGYNSFESQQKSTTNVTAEASSLQVAYSTGGASIRLARGSSDNQDYNTGADYDRDMTVLSVALAF